MPLIVDPALQAEVIRQFNLRGELAPFNLTENVVPIFDIGTLLRDIDPTVVTTLAGSQGVRVGLAAGDTLQTADKRIEDTNVVDGGVTVNPGAGALLADSGQLAAGTSRIWATFGSTAALSGLELAWRDAADAADLAVWRFLYGAGQSIQFRETCHFLLNERLVVRNTGATVGSAVAALSFTTPISFSGAN